MKAKEEVKLILISLEGCAGCADAKKQLKKASLQKILKQKFGTSTYKELKVNKDKLAVEIANTLKLEAVPQLVAYNKKNKSLCILNTNLTAKKCVPFTK